MTSYRDAAELLWGAAGAYAHDVYGRLRREHFPELPAELPIVIGITAYGHCRGLTRGGWDAGPRISLASNLFAAGRRHVDDVLLHEMLHAGLIVRGEASGHDTEPWYEAVRRLSPVVLGHGLEGARRGGARRSVRVPNPHRRSVLDPETVVRKVKVDGAVSHGDVARWPAAFRPEGYDPGEPIACPSY